MKNKFTALCVLIGAYLTSAIAQEKREFLEFKDPTERKYYEQRQEMPEVNQLRSSQETTAWPDSTITFTSVGQKQSKNVYEYDHNGKVISYQNLSWNTKDNQWVNNSMTIYEYDQNGNQILYLSLSWSAKDNQWINNSKIINEYDQNGKPILYLSLSWSAKDNQWINDSKSIREYDQNGNQVLYLYFNWNAEGNQWINNSKTIYEYDQNGNRTRSETYFWKNNIWEGRDKYVCQYNNRNNIIFYDEYSWNDNTASWILSMRQKNEYTYDSKDQQIMMIGYRWKDNQWENYEKYIYEYNDNADGREIVEEGYCWVESDHYPNIKNTWAGAEGFVSSDGRKSYHSMRSKSIHKYDLQGNVILDRNHRWDLISHRWREDGFCWEYIYEYDSNNRIINEIRRNNNSWDYTGIDEITGTRYTYNYNDQGDKTISKNYSRNGDKWEFSKYTIYYPNTQTSELEVNESQPVGSSNKGTIEFKFSLPTDETFIGKVTIQLSNGIALNIDKTRLSPELADKLDLAIIPQENNSWLIEIRFKSLKSAMEKYNYQKILDIVYDVDPVLGKGTYNLLIRDLDFELKDGTHIIEQFRTIPIEVLRYGMKIDELNTASFKAYFNNEQLVVDSPQAETVEICSISGRILCSENKPIGKITMDVKNFTHGILIVKGSSGWVSKIIK